MPEDMKKKDSACKYFNEIVVLRYFYPEDAEGILVSPSKQVWEHDFDRAVACVRNSMFFAEYVFTDDFDKVNDHIEMLMRHAETAIGERKYSFLDMTYPFRKRTNIATLDGFDYSPDIRLWE